MYVYDLYGNDYNRVVLKDAIQSDDNTFVIPEIFLNYLRPIRSCKISWTIVAGENECMIKRCNYNGRRDVIIPPVINGLRVTAIGKEAFSGRYYKKVVLVSNTPIILENKCFANMLSTEKIEIFAPIKSIGDDVFDNTPAEISFRR